MIDSDWNKFIELTGYASEIGGKPFTPTKQNLWWQLLIEYDINEIEMALFKHLKSSSFEPKPADLIKLMEPDYDEMFDRCINRQPKNQLESVTWTSVGHACRTQLSEKDARLRFKKEYQRQVELSKNPRAQQSHQIGHKPEPKITDQIIDQGAERYKGKSPEEIKEMLHSMKSKTKLKR